MDYLLVQMELELVNASNNCSFDWLPNYRSIYLVVVAP